MQKLELHPQIIRVKGSSPDYEAVFSAMDHECPGVGGIGRANQCGLQKANCRAGFLSPITYSLCEEQVDAGGLIAYGTSLREAAKHMAVYTDKILKGVRPGDLPIEVALRHELVINLRTARRFGITVPLESLVRLTPTVGRTGQNLGTGGKDSDSSRYWQASQRTSHERAEPARSIVF